MNWLSLLPLTALIAIVLFIVKELLEFIRRFGADRRKTQALKDLLARECELNLWVVSSLTRIFSEIAAQNENPQINVEVGHQSSGRPIIKVFSSDGGLETRMGIPKPQRDLMSALLLDVATLDRDLFTLVGPAYESLVHLEHLRESLLNADEESSIVGQDNYLGGLATYALDKLRQAEAALAALYRGCTGDQLSQRRLR